MREEGGFFITVEGADPISKRNLATGLVAHFAARGHRVLLTSDSGGTPFAKTVVETMASADDPVDPVTAMLMLTAARRHVMTHVVSPALRCGEIVICQGFVHSMIARWSSQTEISADLALGLHSQGCDDLWPDLALLVDDAAPAQLVERAPRRIDFYRSALRRAMRYTPGGDYGIVEDKRGAQTPLSQAIQMIESNDLFEHYLAHRPMISRIRAA